MARPPKTDPDNDVIRKPIGRPPSTGVNRGYRKPKPEELADPNEPPVFTLTECAQLEKLATFGTAEEFQKGFAMFVRRLLVRGLENVPTPRTIKELQALADMCRKAEGLDKNVPSNAVVIGGGLVRVGGVRRNTVVVDAMDSVSGNSPDTSEEAPQTDAPDPSEESSNSGSHNGDTTPSIDDFEV